MNIALSVLILVVLLLPGATVVRAYSSSLTRPKSNLHIPFNDLLFRGLIFSFIIHCIGVCVLRIFDQVIDFTLLYQLIAGKDLTTGNVQIGREFRQFALYTIIVIFCSWLASKTVRNFILRRNYDLRNEGLTAQNYWYIIFSGRFLETEGRDLKNIDFIFIDVLADTGSIYSGILVDFNYSRQKDQLENIIITGARRRELIKDPNNEDKKLIGPPVQIPGDVFILPAQKIVNINVSCVETHQE